MRIRAFELADYEDAHALWSAAEHLGAMPRGEVELKLRRDPQLFLVADDDAGRLVGVVMGSTDGRRGWIYRLAVHPDRRKQGIATALIEELERRLLDLGITKVNLLVLTANEGGRAFWERLGYAGFEDIALHSKDLGGAPLDGPAC